jgi:PAS domain S-box-containing protein
MRRLFGERAARPATWRQYGAAVLLVFLAVALTAVLRPSLQATPLAPFFVAVALAAWYGGLGPALLAIALSVPTISFWVLAPYVPWSNLWLHVEIVTTFLFVSLIISSLSASRDRAEAALRASERRFSLAADAVHALIYEWDLATGRVERTTGLQPLLGYRPDEASPDLQWWRERIHPDDLAHVDATSVVTQSEGDGYSQEYRLRHRDGRWITVWDQGRIVRDGDGRVVRAVGSTIDITARTEAETRYRGLFEGTKDGILLIDPTGACVDVNPALLEMTGRTRPDLIGVAATVVACGGPWSGEDGERLRREGQWRGEFELRHQNGTLIPVESWITTVSLPTGPVYVGVLRDVSQRRRFEQLQEEFLSALAHDLKNPLTTVRGQTQLLRRRLARGEAPDGRLHAGLESIDAAARRMTRLIDELADILRLRAGQEIELHREQTDLVALARRTTEEHGSATERHTITCIAAVATLIGFWDGPRLERVLGNLLGNAVKYSPRGGEITVRVAREERGDDDIAILSVEDRGVGIPAADRDLIFERFGRAGNVATFAGSGIGLAGARRIVELHGGTISVTSTEGAGSTFTVQLPVTTA